jgi:two-component system, OmpR family, response regulator CpxR
MRDATPDTAAPAEPGATVVSEMETAPARSVLLIDDDEELCELLRKFLGHEGFSIEVVNDGAAGLERAATGVHSVVVLDVMLPTLNGFDVLRELRRRSQVPVIMLTARGEDVDRIVGLEMGADDYQAKPFNARELVARIRAIQRRTVQEPSSVVAGEGPRSASQVQRLTPVPSRVLVVGDVVLNPQLRSVHRAEREVVLTSVEFTILELLLKSAGSIVSREDLAQDALGRRLSHSDRSVDVHVSNLRKKLGHAGDGKDRIKSIRGVGYQYTLG